MNIMILTSYHTGHGHASITNALTGVLNGYEINYKVVDMVEQCGLIVKKAHKSYGKITTKAQWLWRFAYWFGHKQKRFANWIIKQSIKRKFWLQVDAFQPDTIISVHPNFVGNCIDILSKYQYNCKFVTVVADLVSINNLWLDNRADTIFCPTHDSLQKAIKYGIPEKQLVKCTLPSRQQITAVAKEVSLDTVPFRQGIHCLIMSGGEGSGNLEDIIDNLLSHPKAILSVITGRNKKIYEKLRRKYSVSNRVTVYGFVDNMGTIYSKHDIAIVRGSPNVIMECINLLIPLIITGCLPGQEQGNDQWVQKNGFGLICHNPSELCETLDKYYQNDSQQLKQTRLNQAQYRDLQATEKIVHNILSGYIE